MGNRFIEQQARNLVIMLNAGGLPEDVIALAKNFRIRPIHVHQLAVPNEELGARRRLLELLQNGSN